VAGDIPECADLAFLLATEETERTRALAKPPGLLVGISPSSVLAAKLGGQAYVALMSGVISRVLTDDPRAEVWICAHAFRNKDTTSNNDGPVCRQVHEALPPALRSRARLVAGDYTPGEMRAIIARTDAFLACRFHSMVSALAAGVPVAVLGWSHKYREVMEYFGLDLCINSREATGESVQAILNKVIAERAQLKETILRGLPAVRQSAGRNFEILEAFADKLAGAEVPRP
jgi:polysaccharide pyruvyl transferase WcaK-like protein